MIRISRPKRAPAILGPKGKGKKQRARLCGAYTRSPKAYRDGTKTFEGDFDSRICGHKTVKRALITAQNGKCCFCESKFEHVAFGDVEHFRPKGGFQQRPGDPVGRPGYYWLAYEWSNLLIACPRCNRERKKNLFPLADPSKRALCHHDDLTQEDPLLINPAEEDPEEYVSFRDEVPYAIDGNPKGRTTISALGLDRQPLNEQRLERLKMLRGLHLVASISPPLPRSEGTRALLQEATQDAAEYAAMARAAAESGFSGAL